MPPQTCPPAVVVSRPSERFVRFPRPTVVGVNPVSVGVRPPAGGAGFAWLPDVAVRVDFDPVAQGIERRVEEIQFPLVLILLCLACIFAVARLPLRRGGAVTSCREIGLTLREAALGSFPL